MKILFIGRYALVETLSGPEKVAKRLYSKISKETSSEFWEYYFDGTKYGYYKKLFGSEVMNNGSSVIARKGVFSAVLDLFKLRPDVVHIITFERFALIFILFKWLFRYKICYNIHGIINFERESKGLNKFSFTSMKDLLTEKMIFKYSDKLFFLSVKSVELAQRYFKIASAKISFIKNGIDDIFCRSKENEIIKTEYLRILFVGDLKRKEKGLHFFMSTMGKVSFPVRLTIIGECPVFENNNPNLEIYICQKSDTATFAEIIRDNDVYVSASSFDTFPVSSIEAMASGLIPVLTRETGSSDIINEFKNGCIYNYGDSAALLEILERLNSDATLRSELSRKSSAIYYLFQWDRITENYLYMYKQLTACEK